MRIVKIIQKTMLVIFALLSAAYAENRSVITLATTTSTENSGLLQFLLPNFTKETNIKVRVIAVGSGKALKLGENGDVDILLVHAPENEADFINKGFGIDRHQVMHNDFIIVGPASDCAQIKGEKHAASALRKIASGKSTFFSRGDESGTHKKEKELWATISIKPEGDWYREAGQGMEAILMMAYEKQGYTLTDRGTYLSVTEKINLPILFEGDPLLANPYGIIAVNPQRHPGVNYRDALQLIKWITSPVGQNLIDTYTFNGKRLFYSYLDIK